LALDGLPAKEALRLTAALGHRCHAIKIHDLFDKVGSRIAHDLSKSGTRVLVDAKLHDIPKTVANRALAIVNHGASPVTVHASGGVPMMKAIVDLSQSAHTGQSEAGAAYTADC